MTFKPISDSVFIEGKTTLDLHLDISPQKTIELQCSIDKTWNAWQIAVHMVCIISKQQAQAPQKFICDLGEVNLEPLESRTIGAWRDVFKRSNGDQWYLPLLSLEGSQTEHMDPIEGLAKYANQDLLEITAYNNGISIKSEYLTLKV